MNAAEQQQTSKQLHHVSVPPAKGLQGPTSLVALTVGGSVEAKSFVGGIWRSRAQPIQRGAAARDEFGDFVRSGGRQRLVGEEHDSFPFCEMQDADRGLGATVDLWRVTQV